MPIDPGPHDLTSERLILDASQNAIAKAVTQSFYAELGDDFGSFHGHVLISQHSFSEPWPTWEIHPEGDEIVYLLSGDTDFVLKLPGGERTVRVHAPNSYVVVPKGTWHTARPHAPTTMLFVTPGEGTRNAETPG
jgi:mannose-6-phosphate isomerase-like protein (cupin superfamily)